MLPGASIRGGRAHDGSWPARWPIYAPFICCACAQVCLTGLWPVATLVSEALSAGFADAASTAIPAHSEAKATPSLETCSASAPVYGGLSQAQRNRLPVIVQAAASALGSPPSGSRSEQGAPVPPEPLCTLLEMGLTSPDWRTWPATVRYAPCGACCQNAEAVDGAADESGAGCYGRRPTF